jgi:hypothetical protein
VGAIPGLPPAESRYLAAVASTVTATLGDSLVGLYPSGSLALGGYRPGRSDIDLAVVVDGEVDSVARRDLAQRLDHAQLPCPAAGLELVVYPLPVTREPSGEAGYLLNLNTGRDLPPLARVDPAGDHAFWYVIDRDVTRQCGRALLGPPVAAVFGPLPEPELLRAVVASVQEHLTSLSAHLGENAVLNGCRAWSFGGDGRWRTKAEAGKQYSTVAAGDDRHAPLVRAALAAFEQPRRTAPALDHDLVRAFLHDVQAGLEDRLVVGS